MKKNQLIQDITSGDLLSAYVVAPFDEGLEVLQKNNYSLISLEENAMLRIQEGPQAYISQNGNWVSEDVPYIPYKGIYLSKAGILNRNAKKATQSHRDGTDFYLTDDQVEEYRSDCVLLSTSSRNFSIPTNRFNEYEITNYAFGEQAEAYGNFLKENGIKEMPIWLTNMQDKPFAKKLRFSSLGFRSGLNGGSGDLCIYLNRARGVRKNIQESK